LTYGGGDFSTTAAEGLASSGDSLYISFYKPSGNDSYSNKLGTIVNGEVSNVVDYYPFDADMDCIGIDAMQTIFCINTKQEPNEVCLYRVSRYPAGYDLIGSFISINNPSGMTFVGDDLYVVDLITNELHVLSLETGQKLYSIPLDPSISLYGLAAFQTREEVDLEVSGPNIDVAVSPPSPVGINDVVDVSAFIENYCCMCYIVLGDNSDMVDYNFNLSSAIADYKVEARVRSSNGNSLTANVWVDALGISPFSTNSTSWEVQTAAGVALGSGSHVLHVELVGGGDVDTDLHLDCLDFYKWDGSEWVLLIRFEAEDYTGGGPSVDAIHPQNVTVQFYNGDPDAGGVQIGSDQIASDSLKTTVAGSTPILTAGGAATVSVNWTAGDVGNYQLYAKIIPDPLEANTGNNKAYCNVRAHIIPTLSEWGMIILLLLLVSAAIIVIRRRQALTG
jgi:hypothetical protein